MGRGATGALLLALLTLSGCGSSHSSLSSSKSTSAPPAPQPGLGATRSSFDAAHGSSSQETLARDTLYTLVTSNAARRVVSYQVTFASAMSDIERLNLLGGTALPAGAIVAQETPYCKLWRSAKLRELVGLEYARATTVPGTTSAQIRATSIPSC